MKKDIGELIHPIIDPLIEHPESVMLRELPSDSENHVTILIVAESNDVARLIGKKGSIANDLREIVSVAGKLSKDESNIKYHLKFDSFDSDSTEETDGK